MTDRPVVQETPIRLAAFGFRSFPPGPGAAGADKFALELLPRLAQRGCVVTAYTRRYPGDGGPADEHVHAGVHVVPIRTYRTKGLEAFLHSAKVTIDILFRHPADVVHIQNGGNAPFAAILRLFGKKVFISEDGFEWRRDKWPWYGKLYLRMTQYLTAVVPNTIIFDNIFTKQYFEKKFNREYHFIPYGSEVKYDNNSEDIIDSLGLERKKYFLFVGRFIPDKGLHYLVPAFERLVAPDVKLVMVGGSLNPSAYEETIRSTTDPRIVMPGFIYGPQMHALMKNSLAYVQPSEIEGLSPVILESAFLGAPLICSDLPENRYILGENAMYFESKSMESLHDRLAEVCAAPESVATMAAAAQRHVETTFSWEAVANDHLALFRSGGAPATA